MQSIKNRLISLILFLAVIVSSVSFPSKKVKAGSTVDALLEEYADEYTYLGSSNTIYHGYVEMIPVPYPPYSKHPQYSCKGVFPIAPISYRIDDYDQDGQNELLIVTMDEIFSVKFEMYEVENNNVVLKDSSLFVSFAYDYGDYPIEYVHAGVYWEDEELNCFTYDHQGSKIIAIENYHLAHISADGMGYDYVMVSYNGDKLSIMNESHGAGSDFPEEVIQNTNKEFEKMGIILDSSKLYDRKEKVSDHIDNKIVFASAKTESKENAWEIINNSTGDKIENISDITFTMKNTGNVVSDSDFNMNIFRANLLTDDNYPATKGLNYNMTGDTPSEIFISAAQENGLQYAVMAWEAVTATLDAVDSPSSLIDFSMEEKDLYSAVILNLLQVSVESDIASSCQDAIKDAKKVSSKVKSWMQESFNLDVAEKENFNAMTYEQKKSLIYKTEEDFKKQYDEDLGSINKVFSNISNVLEAADCIETYLENVATMCELAKISDSMKMVMNDMYKSCPESKKALKSALRDCVSIINAGADQFIDKIATCTEMYVGLQAVKFGVDEIWDVIKKQINFANPTLFILTECYKVDKYIVNELFSTDAISEQYMNMLAVADVEDLIIKVLQSSKNKYKNKPLEDNAKVYLSAIDYFYAGLDYDCKSAYKFVDAVDDALVSQIAALLGGSNNEGVKNSIKSIQQSYYSNYVISILSSWIYELEADYPNSGLYERYEALLDKNYKKAVTKKYGVACPVDVYVYDKNNQLVAYVIDNKPYSAGDTTVVVEGTSKTLYFYDADKYHIRYVGTGVGDMEASMEEYDQAGNIVRQVDYCKVPLSEGFTYETEIKQDEAITPLKDNEGKIITADLDTDTLQGNNIKVQIENGVLLSANGPVFSAELPFNDEVSVYAYVPDGYTFEHWTSDAGADLFEDAGSQVTTFRMPNNDIKISAVLTKKQVNVEKITLSLSSQGIESGKTLLLTATVEPKNADNVKLNWTSDNTAVATVDQHGLVTAVGVGQATITATSTDGSNVSGACVVTVTQTSDENPSENGDENSSGGNNEGGSSGGDGENSGGSSSNGSGGNNGGGSSNGTGGNSGGSSSGGSGNNNSGNTSDGPDDGDKNQGNTSDGTNTDDQLNIRLLYYIVAFNANGGTKLSRNTTTLLMDDTLGILPKIQRKQYDFKGWYTQKSGGQKVTQATVLNASTTLYAQWSKVAKAAEPAKVSLTAKKGRQMKVSYKKVSGVSGYQIVYSTSKKFAASATKKVTTDSTSKILKNLKKGKTYYVKVRAYKIDSAGNKVYGAYSGKKSVKIKA